ncbi:MAG: hypothetical protein AB7U85_04850 [Alphaproteobacteria bacterium]
MPALLKSPTFYAALVIAIANILSYFGFEVGDADKTELSTNLTGLVTSISGLVILWRKIKSTKSSKIIVFAISLPFALSMLSACAFNAAETSAQKVYALQAEFNVVQEAALAYVTSEQADATIKLTVKRLEGITYASIKAAQNAVVAGNAPALPALLAAGKEALTELTNYLLEKGII